MFTMIYRNARRPERTIAFSLVVIQTPTSVARFALRSTVHRATLATLCHAVLAYASVCCGITDGVSFGKLYGLLSNKHSRRTSTYDTISTPYLNAESGTARLAFLSAIYRAIHASGRHPIRACTRIY